MTTYEQQARQIIADEEVHEIMHAKGECEHFNTPQTYTDRELNEMGRDIIKDILVKLGHSEEQITDKLVERTIMNCLWANMPKYRGTVNQF